MKFTVLILAFVLLLRVSLPAVSKDWRLKTQPALHQQLAMLLTCPNLLEKGRPGIVILQFQVSDDSRICRVRVFSGNKSIDAHFIRQLTGRKLQISNPEFQEVYTVRMHLNRRNAPS